MKTDERLLDLWGDGEAINLSGFLNYAVALGALKGATAQSYRTAVEAVLAVIDRGLQEIDVRQLDVESWCEIFDKARSDLQPGTRSTYRTRFRRSVDMYRIWLADPDSFLGNVEVRDRDTLRLKPGELITGPHHGSVRFTTNFDRLMEAGQVRVSETPDLVSYPFPLADGRLATLSLPHPLSRSDAERLSQYVLSLATEPTEPAPKPSKEWNPPTFYKADTSYLDRSMTVGGSDVTASDEDEADVPRP